MIGGNWVEDGPIIARLLGGGHWELMKLGGDDSGHMVIGQRISSTRPAQPAAEMSGIGPVVGVLRWERVCFYDGGVPKAIKGNDLRCGIECGILGIQRLQSHTW